jgi:hypothetical protein
LNPGKEVIEDGANKEVRESFKVSEGVLIR